MAFLVSVLLSFLLGIPCLHSAANPEVQTDGFSNRTRAILSPLGKVRPHAVQVGAAQGLSHVFRTQVPQYLTEGKAGYSKSGLNTGAIGKNLFQYALVVGGIGAATSIVQDYKRTGQVNPERALDFLTNSDFVKSSLGIFAGATLFSIAGQFLPPGVPLILKTVPGFLGAALGFEWSQGSLDRTDIVKAVFSALASSAAFVALGSGGALAIGAGILASFAANSVYDRFFGKDEAHSLQGLPPSYETWQPNVQQDPDSNLFPVENSSEEPFFRERVRFRQIEETAKSNNQEEFFRLRKEVVEGTE